MAFEKQICDLKILFLMLVGIPLIASTNIDCGGKSFHCLNSTHFMICVDLGGGVSTTVDDFVIPCPPPTVCLKSNRFECEFPVRTTAAPTILPIELTNEPEITTQAWEVIGVTTVLPTTDIEQHLELGSVNLTQDVKEATVIPLDTVLNTTEISLNVFDTNTVQTLGNLLNETTAEDLAVLGIGTETTIELVEPVLSATDSTNVSLYAVTTENTLTSDISIIPLETYNVNRTERSNITTEIVTEYNIVTTTEYIITNTPLIDTDIANNYNEAATGNVLDTNKNETIGTNGLDTIMIVTVSSTSDNITSVSEPFGGIMNTTSLDGAVLSEVTTEAFDLVNNLTSLDSAASVIDNKKVSLAESIVIDATTITSDTAVENTNVVVSDTLKNDTESLSILPKLEVSVEPVPNVTLSSIASVENIDSIVHDKGIFKNDTGLLSIPTKPEPSDEPTPTATVSYIVSIVNESEGSSIIFNTEASTTAAINNGMLKNDYESLSLPTKSNLNIETTPSTTILSTETIINKSNVDSYIPTTEKNESVVDEKGTLINDTESHVYTSISSRPEGNVESIVSAVLSTTSPNKSNVDSIEPVASANADTRMNTSSNVTELSTKETIPNQTTILPDETIKHLTSSDISETVDVAKDKQIVPLTTLSSVTQTITRLPNQLGPISPNNVTTIEIVTDSTRTLGSVNEVKNTHAIENIFITPPINITTVSGNETFPTVVITTSATTTISSSSLLPKTDLGDAISPETTVTTESTLYFTTVSNTNELVIDTVTEKVAAETTITTGLAEVFSSNYINNKHNESADVNLNVEETISLFNANVRTLSNQTTKYGSDTLSTTTLSNVDIVLESTKPNVYIENQVNQNYINITTATVTITNQETVEPQKVKDNTTNIESNNQISQQLQNAEVISDFMGKSSTTELPIQSIIDNIRISTNIPLVKTTDTNTANISSDNTNMYSTQQKFAYEVSSTTSHSTVSEITNPVQGQGAPTSDMNNNNNRTTTPSISTLTPWIKVKTIEDKKEILGENIEINSQQQSIGSDILNVAVTSDINRGLQAEKPFASDDITHYISVTEIATKTEEIVISSATQTLENVSVTQSITDKIVIPESYDMRSQKSEEVSTSTLKTESLLASTHTHEPEPDALPSLNNSATNPLENVLLNGTVSEESSATTQDNKIEESVRQSITTQSTLSPVLDMETMSTPESSLVATTKDSLLVIHENSFSTSVSIPVKLIENQDFILNKPLETTSNPLITDTEDYIGVGTDKPVSVSVVNTEINVIPSDNILINETTEVTSKQRPQLNVDDITLLGSDTGNIFNTNKFTPTSIHIKKNETNPLDNILMNGTIQSIHKQISSVNVEDNLLTDELALNTWNNETKLFENTLLNGTVASTSEGSSFVSTAGSILVESKGNISVSDPLHVVIPESNPLENVLLNTTSSKRLSASEVINQSSVLAENGGNNTNTLELHIINTENHEINHLENVIFNGSTTVVSKGVLMTNKDGSTLTESTGNVTNKSFFNSFNIENNASNPLENLVLNGTNGESISVSGLLTAKDNVSNLAENIFLNKTIQTTFNASHLTDNEEIVLVKSGGNQSKSGLLNETNSKDTTVLNINKSASPESGVSGSTIVVSNGVVTILDQQYSTSKASDDTGVVAPIITIEDKRLSTQAHLGVSSTSTESAMLSPATISQGIDVTQKVSTNKSIINDGKITVESETISGNNDYPVTVTPKIIIEQTENSESSTITVKSSILSSTANSTSNRKSAWILNSEQNNSQSIGITTETTINLNNLREINLTGKSVIDVALSTDNLYAPISTTKSMYGKKNKGYFTSIPEVTNETPRQETTSSAQLTTESIIKESVVLNKDRDIPTTVFPTTSVWPLLPTAPYSYVVQIDNLEPYSTTSPVQTHLVASKSPLKLTTVDSSSIIHVNTDIVTEVNNVGTAITKLSDNNEQILHTDITNIFTNQDKITTDQNVNSELQPDISHKMSSRQQNDWTKIASVTTSPSVDDYTLKIGVTLPIKATTEMAVTRANEQPHEELERKAVIQIHGDISTKPTTSVASSGQKTSTIKPVFDCRPRPKGRHADNDDCRKFYICSGIARAIIGLCPVNTVFSEIRKQCTKNLSHCIRGNEFKCVSPGRFSDYTKQNVYYICVQKEHSFLRYKMQCQNGYFLNRTTVRCYKKTEISSQSISIDNSQSTSEKKSKEKHKSDKKSKSKSESDFECEEEGKFPDPDNCRRYYVCSKSNKSSEFRRKSKKCDKDEVFHKKKKKCVDHDSYECP